MGGKTCTKYFQCISTDKVPYKLQLFYSIATQRFEHLQQEVEQDLPVSCGKKL